MAMVDDHCSLVGTKRVGHLECYLCQMLLSFSEECVRCVCVCATNLAKITNLRSSSFCRLLLTRNDLCTDRHDRVHDQQPLYGRWLIIRPAPRHRIDLMQFVLISCVKSDNLG